MKFLPGGVQIRATRNWRVGMIVTSFKDIICRDKKQLRNLLPAKQNVP